MADPTIEFTTAIEWFRKCPLLVQIGLLLLLFRYTPLMGASHWTYPTNHGFIFDPHQQWLGLVAFFAYLLVTQNNISGILRFGIRTYGHHFASFVPQTPVWAPFAFYFVIFIVLPPGPVLIAVPFIWYYIRDHHREASQKLSDRVAAAASRASKAAANAHHSATDATRYEHHIIELAATAQRDGRLAQGVKLTDFFDTSAAAWAALDRIATTAHEAVTAAERTDADASAANYAAANLTSTYSTTDTQNYAIRARDFYEKAETASVSAATAEGRAKEARARAADYAAARAQGDRAREEERQHAIRVARVVEQAMIYNSRALEAAREAAERAEYAAQICKAECRTSAAEGDIEVSGSWAKKAEDAAIAAGEAEKRAESALLSVRGQVKVLTGSA